MASTPKPETETQVTAKQPYWSWKDDEFIAQGKFSWLAFGEIFLAMAFYWWMANYFERPWVLVLSICIAPILLLRSEASIKFGTKLLKKSMESRGLTKTQMWFVSSLSCALCVYLSYSFSAWLSYEWLTEYVGWAMIWRIVFIFIAAGVFGGLVATFIFTPVFAYGVNMGILGAVLVPVGIVLGILSASIALVEFTSAAVLTIVALTISAVALFLAWSLPATAVLMVVFPCTMIGMCLIGWFFRFRATTAHFSEGIAEFSLNLRETILVSDIRNAPSLLPGAGKVSKGYNGATLFNINGEKDAYVYFGKFITLILFTFVATLYRWNIKASALIWAPIALGLSPTNWRNYTEMREQSSLSSEKWLFYTSVGFLVALTTLLIAIPYSLSDFIASIPKWMDSKTMIGFIPQQKTLRYGLVCLFSLSFAVQLFLAWRMRTQHDKPLSSAADFKPYFEDAKLKDDLDSFSKQANQLHRMLKINTAIAIFTVWAFALKFAIDKWPHVLQKLVWDWLKPLL